MLFFHEMIRRHNARAALGLVSLVAASRPSASFSFAQSRPIAPLAAVRSQVRFTTSVPPPVEGSDPLSADDVLTVRMQYAVVTFAWAPQLTGKQDVVFFDSESSSFFYANSNDPKSARDLAAWLASVRRTVGAHARMLLYPAHPLTKTVTDTVLFKTISPEVVVNKCAWEVVRGIFNTQQSVIRQAAPPASLEHAYLDLHGAKYDCLIKASVKTASKGSSDLVSDLDKPTPARLAVLAWDTMTSMFKRFGTEGGKKNFTPTEHMVRAAVKTVNVFVVDCDNKIQNGSVKNGITFASEVYSCQTRRSTCTQFRSLQDQSKLDVLTTLLFGEGSNTVSVLIPSARTKSHQVMFFARMCRPKCPFFIADPKAISRFLPRHMSLSEFCGTEADAKRYWGEMTNAIGKGMDEDTRHETLLRAATAFALSASKGRSDVNAVSLAQQAGRGVLVAPLEEAEAFANVTDFTERPVASSGPAASKVTPAAKQFVSAVNHTYVNKVNLSNASAVISLDEWKKKIYFNPDRLEREKNAAKSIARYLIVDLETTTAKRYKRIANPFTGENWVVLSGAKDYTGKVFMNDVYYPKHVAQHYDDLKLVKKHKGGVKGASPRSLFLPPLDGYDVIVGHNLKFDLMHIWRDHELRAFFKRGGKIWDTLYGEYLLTGHQVRLGRGAGLEDVAKSYGGRTPKLDEVKQAWAEGKQTYDIAPETLKEYLHGDLDNTELIFKKHLVKMVDQRQALITQARMDSLLCTTEMEYNGLKIDLNVAINQATELNEKASELARLTYDMVPSEVPSKLKKYWNWASNQHMALYFFGGPFSFSTDSFLSEKNLPRSTWGRHTLSDAARAPTYLGPPNIIAGPAEFALIAGGYTSEKTTKLSSSYLLHYMSDGGFRKSAPWMESLASVVTAVSRSDGKKTKAPLIDLMPKRHLILMAAADADFVTGNFTSLHIRNPITNESGTFDVTAAKGVAELEDFLLSQVKAHTCRIVDESNSLQKAFTSAHVTLVTRDAPFTFAAGFEGSDALKAFIGKYGFNREYVDMSAPPEMTVNFADANPALEFFRLNTDVRHIPSELVAPVARRTEASRADPFHSDFTMDAKSWCAKYGPLLREVAHANFAEVDAVVKKPTKKQREARQREESSLPLLMRSLATLRATLPTEYTAAELAHYELMYFLGKMLCTNFDPFYVIGYPKAMEIIIPGVLNTYIPEKGVALAIMEKFRSPSTHALQVGTETLSYFASTHKDPVAKAITNLRAMQKLIGTYYEFSEGGTGMVSLVHETDSCIHHELIHTKTNTGRLASANPNCQNIPKEDKSPLREMFVSRFDNGICIEADYSQLEVITLAALANDREMIRDLENKVDFHCKRVTMIRPDLSYEDVVLRAKKNKEPEFVKLRQQAKIFSFQRQYGAGVKMLSESTGLSGDQVRSLIEREREIYADCDTFANMVTLSANAYDPTIQDGIRNVEGQLLYKGLFPVVTGTRYVFSESDLPAVAMGNLASWEKRTNFSPTHLKNYPVQGFAGEIVQIMLGKLWRHFVANDNYKGKALLINTVHDCVWVDSTNDVTAEVAKDVEVVMGDVKNTLNSMYPEMAVVVDFPLDVVAGENMCHLRPLKELPQILKAQEERSEKK